MGDVPAPQESVPLDLAPPDHTRPGETMNHLTNTVRKLTLCPLAELLEQFQQLQDQFTCLKSAIHPSTHMVELKQLTDKLEHLTMMLQPHPTSPA